MLLHPKLLVLMKERLPGYVQKCFLASGFDTEDAIAYMDADSITTMETFVHKTRESDIEKLLQTKYNIK